MSHFGLMRLALASSVVALSGAVLAEEPSYFAKGPTYGASSRWTGFYVGLNAGYAWSDANAGSTFSCLTGPATPCNYNNDTIANRGNLTIIGNGASGALSDTGFAGGLQGGFNWVSGGVLIGAESDFNAFRLGSKHQTTSVLPTLVPIIVTSSASVETNWLFTARGRLGWAATSSMMLYGTGGLAATDGQASNFFTDYFSPSETGGSSKSNILIGYVVGGGAEWALDRQWSLKAEYLFLNFGSISTSVSDLNTPGSGFGNNALATKVDLDAQIVRVGLNHKF